MELPTITNLDAVLICIALHLNPEYLMNPVISKVRGAQGRRCERYNFALVGIKQALTKVMRYPVIFEKLYSYDKTEITDAEALEHHVHAYLEDLDRFKNKIQILMGMLKNDLKQIASNKKEIVDAMDLLDQRVCDAFDNVSKHRNPHHHKGMNFLDSNLVDVRMAEMALDDRYPLKSMLNEAGLEKLNKMRTEKFEEARVSWIERSRKNCGELSGLIEAVVGRVKGFIYQMLEIPSHEELLKKLQQTARSNGSVAAFEPADA